MSPVCMMSPSESANVRAPGAARRLNSDSRAMYSMSMNSGSVKPHRLTKLTMSVSDTVRLSVRYVAPIACCSYIRPSPIMASSSARRSSATCRSAACSRPRRHPNDTRFPSVADVHHSDSLEGPVILIEPSENSLIGVLLVQPGSSHAHEDQIPGIGALDLPDHLLLHPRRERLDFHEWVGVDVPGRRTPARVEVDLRLGADDGDAVSRRGVLADISRDLA